MMSISEKNTKKEIVVFKPNGTKRRYVSRVKRKFDIEELDSRNNDDQNLCAKIQHIEEDSVYSESVSLPTSIEIFVFNGKWATNQTLCSVFTEIPSVTFQNLDAGNGGFVSSSEGSGSEISSENESGEDDNSTFQQCSQGNACVPSDLDISKSTTQTAYSDTEYKPRNDAENKGDGNFSWLINFNVGSLFNGNEMEHDNHHQGRAEDTNTSPDSNVNATNLQPNENKTKHNTANTYSGSSKPPFTDSDSNVNVGKLQTGENNTKTKRANSCSGSSKPPFTYNELIEQALQENGKLTVSGIYQWISEHFPFYKANDDRWKNSVRHNLSISPHFRKGGKAPNAAGHFWTIANEDQHSYTHLDKSQNMQQCTSNNVILDEVEAAVATIQDITENEDSDTEVLLSITDTSSDTPPDNKENQDPEMELLLSASHENGTEMAQNTSSYTPPTLSLEQVAEEILSGVKKAVEVQYLNPVAQKSPGELDFLNPLSRKEVVEESGLLQDINDIETSSTINNHNPGTLGLSLEEADAMLPDDLFTEDTDFQFC